MLDQAGIYMAQGESIAGERIAGINDNMMNSHYHNYYELYYLEDGERYHLMRDDTYFLNAGEMILFSPYVMHRSYGLENVPFKRIVLYFERDEVDSENLRDALDSGNGVYRPNRQVGRQIHQLLDAIIRIPASCAKFQKDYQHTLLNFLLFTIVLHTQKQDPEEKGSSGRIHEIINYIHTHFQEEITLTDLSRLFYVSPYYLCRDFKRGTGSTIVQYVNVTRIMNAQRQLMETDKTITQISKDTGFSNLTHFNRIFKSVTGLSPSGYRKTGQNTMGGIAMAGETT